MRVIFASIIFLFTFAMVSQACDLHSVLSFHYPCEQTGASGELRVSVPL